MDFRQKIYDIKLSDNFKLLFWLVLKSIFSASSHLKKIDRKLDFIIDCPSTKIVWTTVHFASWCCATSRIFIYLAALRQGCQPAVQKWYFIHRRQRNENVLAAPKLDSIGWKHRLPKGNIFIFFEVASPNDVEKLSKRRVFPISKKQMDYVSFVNRREKNTKSSEENKTFKRRENSEGIICLYFSIFPAPKKASNSPLEKKGKFFFWLSHDFGPWMIQFSST